MLGRTALIAVVAALGWSTGAAAQAPTEDSVTGTIASGFSRADLRLTFDAHSGPAGENPTGTVTIYTFVAGPLGTFPISCLAVSGNRATVVAPFGVAPPAPAGIVIGLEDRGPTGDGVSWSFVSSLPSACSPPATVPAGDSAGDVTVVDALPLPTTKDQCKGGGWRSFPGFKNEGDCVSSVASKRRDQPPG
jgi:hypothetical protein